MVFDDYKAEEGDYKGHKIITIYGRVKGTDKYSRVTSFGLQKGRAIVSVIDDIKKFVEKNIEN